MYGLKFQVQKYHEGTHPKQSTHTHTIDSAEREINIEAQAVILNQYIPANESLLHCKRRLRKQLLYANQQ